MQSSFQNVVASERLRKTRLPVASFSFSTKLYTSLYIFLQTSCWKNIKGAHRLRDCIFKVLVADSTNKSRTAKNREVVQ